LDTRARAEELLRTIAGQSAAFHPNQLEAIAALVDDRRKAFFIQRTGWGKSAVYLIATKLLRERGAIPISDVGSICELLETDD
jgi:ATP-dependent DNA helicase RecQ